MESLFGSSSVPPRSLRKDSANEKIFLSISRFGAGGKVISNNPASRSPARAWVCSHDIVEPGAYLGIVSCRHSVSVAAVTVLHGDYHVSLLHFSVLRPCHSGSCSRAIGALFEIEGRVICTRSGCRATKLVDTAPQRHLSTLRRHQGTQSRAGAGSFRMDCREREGRTFPYYYGSNASRNAEARGSKTGVSGCLAECSSANIGGAVRDAPVARGPEHPRRGGSALFRLRPRRRLGPVEPPSPVTSSCMHAQGGGKMRGGVETKG